MNLKESKLTNGIRVVTDRVDTVETVFLAFCFSVGSRNENSFPRGIAHFLEHMVFKGTKTRSALDISKTIENIGGDINAFTSREQTVWYVKALKDDIEVLADILSDILSNATFAKDEIERERNVIIQEILQGLDTPDDYIHDIFQEQAFGKDTELGVSIAGSTESVSNISREQLVQYSKDMYHSGNLTIVASGNVDHDSLVKILNSKIANINIGNSAKNATSKYFGGVSHFHRADLNQMQLMVGYNGCALRDDNYLHYLALGNILGGGMSSRLFQEVREKRGLVYTIHSYSSAYLDNGVFTIYAATSSSDAKEVMNCIRVELDKIANNSVTEEELLRTKTQLKVGMLMGLERTNSRALRIFDNIRVHGRVRALSEITADIEAIKTEDLRIATQRILSSNVTIATTSADKHSLFI